MDERRAVAEAAAAFGGRVAMEYSGADLATREKTGAVDIVTEADEAAQAAVVRPHPAVHRPSQGVRGAAGTGRPEVRPVQARRVVPVDAGAGRSREPRRDSRTWRRRPVIYGRGCPDDPAGRWHGHRSRRRVLEARQRGDRRHERDCPPGGTRQTGRRRASWQPRGIGTTRTMIHPNIEYI